VWIIGRLQKFAEVIGGEWSKMLTLVGAIEVQLGRLFGETDPVKIAEALLQQGVDAAMERGWTPE